MKKDSAEAKEKSAADQKYIQGLWNNSATSKLFQQGIDIGPDEQGILRSIRPLDPSQKVAIEKFARDNGLVASIRLSTSKDSEGKFDFGGFFVPSAQIKGGLSTEGDKTVQANLKELKGKGKGLPEDKASDGGGLYKAIVPKDSLVDKTASGIGKVAGGAWNVGAGTVKVVGTSAKALTLSAKKAALENQLTHSPNNKELKEKLKKVNDDLKSLGAEAEKTMDKMGKKKKGE